MFLRSTSCNELDAFGYFSKTTVAYEQVDMIRGDDVVKNTEAKAFSGFKEPVTSMITIYCKLEQELFFIAVVNDVPDMAG